MKTIVISLIVGVLLVIASGRSFAEYETDNVSKARAKDLGVTFRTYGNGQAGTTVRMDFKNTGKLKEFDRVEVRIGEKSPPIVTARLYVSRPNPGMARAEFSGDPAYLPKSTFWIYVNDQPLGGTVYQFEVKKFIESATSN